MVSLLQAKAMSQSEYIMYISIEFCNESSRIVWTSSHQLASIFPLKSGDQKQSIKNIVSDIPSSMHCCIRNALNLFLINHLFCATCHCTISKALKKHNTDSLLDKLYPNSENFIILDRNLSCKPLDFYIIKRDLRFCYLIVSNLLYLDQKVAEGLRNILLNSCYKGLHSFLKRSMLFLYTSSDT